MFYEVVSEFPLTAMYLSNDISIVRSIDFEIAIAWIQGEKESKLSTGQQWTLHKFHSVGYKKSEPEWNNENLIATLAERGLKRLKTKSSGTSSFLDTRFMTPTSNVWEKLFKL